jgi:hypothetical protein
MRLAIPDCNESLIYTALCQRLKNDPILKRVVGQWYFWDGILDNASINTLPYVALEPNASNDAVQETYDKTSAMLRLDVNVVVEGVDARDLYNLWSATQKVLFPGDGTLLSLLSTNNAVAMWLERPAYGIGNVEGTRNMTAQATVVVRMLTTTGM